PVPLVGADSAARWGGLRRRCRPGCGAGADIEDDGPAPSAPVALAPGGAVVEGVPAAVPEFHPGGAVAVGREVDPDFGGVGGGGEEVPPVDQAPGRLPHHDRAPVNLVPVAIAL